MREKEGKGGEGSACCWGAGAGCEEPGLGGAANTGCEPGLGASTGCEPGLGASTGCEPGLGASTGSEPGLVGGGAGAGCEEPGLGGAANAGWEPGLGGVADWSWAVCGARPTIRATGDAGSELRIVEREAASACVGGGV